MFEFGGVYVCEAVSKPLDVAAASIAPVEISSEPTGVPTPTSWASASKPTGGHGPKGPCNYIVDIWALKGSYIPTLGSMYVL